MSIFSCFKLAFFTAKSKQRFDHSRSLIENFDEMCSLPFYKPRSIATQQLANLIKLCQLNPPIAREGKEARKKRRQDIAVLQLIKNGITEWRHWHTQTNKVSTRVDGMNAYEQSIHYLLTNLIKQDNQAFISQRTGIWQHPLQLCNKDLNDENYLSIEQLHAFQKLKQLKNTYHKFKNFFSHYFAFCLPMMNYIVSLDSLSLLCDGLDACQMLGVM